MATVSFGVTYQEGRDHFDDLVEYARRVEELGYDSIWMTENIYSGVSSIEPFTALSFFAAHTRRVRLGLGVLLLPLRNPILVAQTATSLDVLSGGRVMLGVGAGDTSPELAMYGCDVRERGRRCDEALAIIKGLWTGTDVTFRGEFYRIENYHLAPRPTQPVHPPLIVGGHEDRVLRRAARWADGFLPTVRSSGGIGKTGGKHGLIEDVAGYTELYEKVERYARELDRDPGGIERMLMVHACLGPDTDRAARLAAEVVSTRLRARRTPSAGLANLNLYGPPAHCRDALQRFMDIGVTHFVIHMTCPPRQSLAQIEELANRVLVHLR